MYFPQMQKRDDFDRFGLSGQYIPNVNHKNATYAGLYFKPNGSTCAVAAGSIRVLEHFHLVCPDIITASLVQAAVVYDQRDVLKWLLRIFPNALNQNFSPNRCRVSYPLQTAMSRNVGILDLLLDFGIDIKLILDKLPGILAEFLRATINLLVDGCGDNAASEDVDIDQRLRAVDLVLDAGCDVNAKIYDGCHSYILTNRFHGHSNMTVVADFIASAMQKMHHVNYCAKHREQYTEFVLRVLKSLLHAGYSINNRECEKCILIDPTLLNFFLLTVVRLRSFNQVPIMIKITAILVENGFDFPKFNPVA